MGAAVPGRETPIELTEDELVEAIARVLSGDEPGVLVGIGDDAAVLEPRGGDLVFTTDLLVEGIHFERGSSSARDLGAKAVTVNVSDVAAMGASPRYAIAAIGVPEDVEAAWVIELTGGMREACAEYALALVGGDTNRAELIVLSVAVVGEVAPRRAVTRSGARPGDRIVVTGSLGAAAGGLAISKAPPEEAAAALSEPWGRELSEALARPVARVGEAEILARTGATAMMDLSDGLAIDLPRLCRSSGVGARVALGKVPVADALERGAGALGVEALPLALSGGEDYELLATMPRDAVETARAGLFEAFGTKLSDVGEIVEGSGVEAVGDDGSTSPLEPAGWDHFGRG
jgi:thiamine-monophosphate kinase